MNFHSDDNKLKLIPKNDLEVRNLLQKRRDELARDAS